LPSGTGELAQTSVTLVYPVSLDTFASPVKWDAVELTDGVVDKSPIFYDLQISQGHMVRARPFPSEVAGTSRVENLSAASES
jgi:hypothetical protein